MGRLTFDFVSHSEIGLVRKNNQDSGYASDTLLLVCDGMGGAAAGDLASSVAAHTLSSVDELPDDAVDADIEAAVAHSMDEANATLLELVSHDHDLEGMGTTVCGVLLTGEHMCVMHVGDSRTYRLRDGEFTRVTHDHSWVQSLIDQGKISEDDAKVHPHRSLLLKVLNGSPSHTPDIWSEPAQVGDRILVCSDGLCGMTDDDVIERILRETPDRDEALTALIGAAHDGGGMDNITILLGDVTDAEHDPVPGAFLGAAAEVDIPDYSGEPEAAHEQVLEEDTTIVPAPSTSSGNKTKGRSGRGKGSSQDSTTRSPSSSRGWWRWLAAILVVLALVAGGFVSARSYLRHQYYIGESGGEVTLYKGLPETVLGVRLHRVADDTFDIRVDSLPTSYQDKVRTHTLRTTDVDQAYGTVHELQQASVQCQETKAKRAQDPSMGPAVDGC